MIASRLRVPVRNFPFAKFSTYEQNGTVYVFIVLPAGPVTLEDDASLFPSDGLMAQLRLLIP
jgi:hypothetical protein